MDCKQNNILKIIPPQHMTPMEKRVFDLEHYLSSVHRHSCIAHKLITIFDHFLLKSKVFLHPLKPLPSGKNLFSCQVWNEREFYIPGKSIGTFVHYSNSRELHVLDNFGNWIYIAPCLDSIYIRGVLTNNLAQYARIHDKTYTFRLSWTTKQGKKSTLFLVDVFP